MERYLALLAQKDALGVFLSLLWALLAVSAWLLPLLVDWNGDDQVIETIIPDLTADHPLWVLEGSAVHCQHLTAELPQEVEQGLLLASDFHAQPPGVDGAGIQRPGIDRKPPLFDPVVDSEKAEQFFRKKTKSGPDIINSFKNLMKMLKMFRKINQHFWLGK